MNTAVKTPPAPLDTKLVAPFIVSVRNLAATMLKVELTLGRPYFKTTANPSYDVSGIIGFSGNVVGSIVMSFQKEAAVKLVATFAGMEMEYGTADFNDAIGELANMIAGGAKKGMDVVATIGVPSVVLGAGHTVARMSGVPCIVLPCSTAAGDFAVEVNIKRTARGG